ncbi:uncharacterized protein LOC130644915 [Hydractinia symbiolongicarpus]|uniref:uncharacterized protein LOC130644915 n=1 Tax=Hydractinia symbiolongicarpus TaxID=13093 RepID=UPI00254FE387|nr:uncharacterized protein LOC130644915 [Hydractinia symbiolongicarpus]
MSKFKEQNYVAPQNSVIEGFKIPRYHINPYMEIKSAPATIHTTPVPTAKEDGNELLQRKFSKQSDLSINEVVANKSIERNPRSAVCINNHLMARLYHHPKNSQVLQHNKFVPHPPNQQKYNSLYAGKRNILLKQKQKAKDDSISDLLIQSEKFSSHSITGEMQTKSKFTGNNLYQNHSVLEVIHALFKRLNWPCDGILSGGIPADFAKCIDTMITKREDDGEFVYFVARDYFCNTARYNPYDLIFITPKEAQKCDLYYTVSASYVSKICKTNGTTLVPVLDWLYERKMFNKIYNINLFKQFRLWKTFTTWKKILRNEKKESSRHVFFVWYFVISSVSVIYILYLSSHPARLQTS